INESAVAAYCSPMQRAKDTAAPFIKQSGLELQILDGLAEIDKYADEYISPHMMKSNPELFKAFLKNPYEVCKIDPEEFYRDVTSAFGQIAESHPGERVVVFSHAIAINVYFADILEKGSDFFGMIPSNCSISRVQIARDGRRSIKAFNDTGHFSFSNV
ncbi:MAG: histidine phosphatase family protein, partial [Chloroflexota bacterium]